MHVFMYVYMCLCVLLLLGVPTETKDQKVGVSELIDEVAEGRILIPQNGSNYT